MPCVLELLSAKSRWAKATKTERHDESLHARNSICHVCLRCTALLQRSSALPLDHKQEQHLAGSVCVCGMQPASVMSALHSVASAQLSPASRPRAKAAPGRKCVCVWNVTGRQKKDIKHAKIKHAETRGTKKHAGRTTSLHATTKLNHAK